MRNLNILFHRDLQVPQGPLTAVSLDSITAHKFYGIANGNVFSGDDTTIEDIIPGQLIPEGQEVTGFEYLALNDEFCLATGTTLSVFNPKVNPDSCEDVAFFDTRITSMGWSPE